MGAVWIRRIELVTTTSEIVGHKAGIALDRDDMVRFLGEESDVVGEDEQLLRIRSEEFEQMIAQLLHAVGNIPSPRIGSFSLNVYHRHKHDKEELRVYSRHMATAVANWLRRTFKGITPNEAGEYQEAPARTAKGFKKLDVNYSTPELGLALGVSIKSISFRDKLGKGRYTKNYSRNDNELRAEATDYHQRQPYSVLIGLVFMPADSCDDASVSKEGKILGPSSFGAVVRFFRSRANRRTPKDDVDLFERFFIGLYDEANGEVLFFDVMNKPPRSGRPDPTDCLTLPQLISEIIRTYDERNDPPFEWSN